MNRRDDLNLRRFAGRSWSNMLLVGMLLVMFGIIMAASKTESVNIVIKVGGALLIIFGIIDFISYSKITHAGAMAIVAGAVMIALAVTVGGPIILGAGIVLMGILMILGAKRFLGLRLDLGNVRKNQVCGVTLIATGIILAANVADLADILMLIVGIIVVVLGCLHIIKALDMMGRI